MMISTSRWANASSFSAWFQKNTRKFIVIGIALCASITSYGQTLEDFKDASNSAGAGLIPFSDMRKEANALEGEVTRSQKASAGLGPSTLSPAKNKILKARRYSEGELKKAEADFKKHADKNSSSFNPWEEDVEEHKEDIKKQNEELEEINEKIDEGIEALTEFWNARGGLREQFEDVVAKAKSWKSNPNKCLGSAPSSSDEEASKEYKKNVALLKGYIDDIVSDIQSGVKTHRKEEETTKKSIAELRTLKGRTAPF